jgi:hypothetical protein
MKRIPNQGRLKQILNHLQPEQRNKHTKLNRSSLQGRRYDKRTIERYTNLQQYFSSKYDAIVKV